MTSKSWRAVLIACLLRSVACVRVTKADIKDDGYTAGPVRPVDWDRWAASCQIIWKKPNEPVGDRLCPKDQPYLVVEEDERLGPSLYCGTQAESQADIEKGRRGEQCCRKLWTWSHGLAQVPEEHRSTSTLKTFNEMRIASDGHCEGMAPEDFKLENEMTWWDRVFYPDEEPSEEERASIKEQLAKVPKTSVLKKQSAFGPDAAPSKTKKSVRFG
eukprot:TRINITY_DN26501_c0_g1_i4.p1 TRINITY_DN26501_c0_g1~~TRINITY_DN26501_c0_g1_i4.p1  ORF type:complete len:215 (-),score=15.02 TRINITY_DN26501_c0_g1_i4:141-785(-)